MRCARISRMRIDLIANEVHFTSFHRSGLLFPQANFTICLRIQISTKRFSLFSLFCLLLARLLQVWIQTKKQKKLAPMESLFYLLTNSFVYLIKYQFAFHMLCVCVCAHARSCVRAYGTFFCLHIEHPASFRRACHCSETQNSINSKCKHFVYKIPSS